MLARLPKAAAIGLGVLAVALLVAIGAVGALLLKGGSSSSSSTRVQANSASNSTATPAAASGTTGKGYLGITVTALPPQSLRVASVVAGGPAASAGIQVGDLIRAVD